MTKSDLAPFASALSRHIMTAASGLLAAHGITLLNNAAVSDQFVTFGTSALLGLVSVGWSLIDKNARVAKAVEAVPSSTLADLAEVIQEFDAKGHDPKIIAHLAQTLAVVATAEIQAFAPTDVEPMPGENVPSPGPVVGGVADVPVTPPIPTGGTVYAHGAVPPVVSGPFAPALDPMTTGATS